MKKINLVLITLLIATTVYLSACATKRLDLVQLGTVKIEKVSSEDGSIKSVNVHQHKDTMEIEVVVTPTEHARNFIAGAVEVEIKDPQGATFNTVQKRAIKKNSPQYSSMLQHAHFWILLPYQPNPGTVITVTHISTDEKAGSQEDNPHP